MPKRNGQVFGFDIIDEEGCEIRITSFDEIAELHYHRVEQGASYVLSKGTVKDANKVYNKLNSQLEIVLTETSVLKRSAPDAVEPRKKERFTPIDELLTTTNNTLVDVIGAIVNVGEIFVIHRKDGSAVNKRIVKIIDMSTLTIDVNLWGPSSEQLGSDLKNMHTSGTFIILAVQNARVGYFNEKFINVSASTTFEINPSIPEAEPLRLRGIVQQCLDPHSSAIHYKNNQYQRMSIASILQCFSIMPETIETTITTILRFIKEEPFYYTTCPLQFNGKECEKKSLVSTDTYNSERRIKVTINKVQRLDFKAESTCLLAEIA
ncbi:replication protein A 70 kDa DNA-binding subunit A-like [Cryptomeria japonica]|uniref:replication protein A 70 kDa DNA-binding subunit A-like n=1 Tax=Cryptomeria japonica TaxID=3369 RepID=UPI0027DA0A8F|nr:replication protein A 70 kDa DNA-binding subunit A-like [Cryptomeria japonica]